MLLPESTAESVIEESVNERIWRETSERVRRYAERPGAIDDRLREARPGVERSNGSSRPMRRSSP